MVFAETHAHKVWIGYILHAIILISNSNEPRPSPRKRKVTMLEFVAMSVGLLFAGLGVFVLVDRYIDKRRKKHTH